ncbi:hypothetical protein GPALN_012329 [Globodera pallida]|nr:hypothetical protein GPALN_012329 [Globodera pallida]
MSTPGTKQNSVKTANKSNTTDSVEQSEKRKAAAKKELRHLIDYFPSAPDENRMTRSRDGNLNHLSAARNIIDHFPGAPDGNQMTRSREIKRRRRARISSFCESGMDE